MSAVTWAVWRLGEQVLSCYVSVSGYPYRESVVYLCTRNSVKQSSETRSVAGITKLKLECRTCMEFVIFAIILLNLCFGSKNCRINVDKSVK